jgi:glycosyltransferase involved in cell wall biosynthesis
VTELEVILPDTVRRADRPSGGNTYDRRVCDGLRSLGWTVREHPVPGSWPRPDAAAYASLDAVTDGVPEGSLVLVDGLVASCSADVLVPLADRVRLAVLVHMPLGLVDEPLPVVDSAPPGAGDLALVTAGERRVLSAADAVVTTSEWTRRRLLDRYRLDPSRVHVAAPGVDEATLAPGSASGGDLICVAAVTQGKGHDQLVAALAQVADLSWHCVCAGSFTLDPGHADLVLRERDRMALGSRIDFVGPLTQDDLDRRYAASDLLVLASRAETYGMVVTEALARGMPVIATSVGGVPEALGAGTDGIRPGILVPADDPLRLGAALRAWLTHAGLRERLRTSARARRETLTRWEHTSQRLADVLAALPG